MLPIQLVKLCHGQFLNEVFDPFRKHVFKIWSDGNIKKIEAEHRELLKLYNADTIVRNMINNHNNEMMFNNAWACISCQFEHLHSFCGGLAIVFANTTSIESYFSILKWEMDDNRIALMHLSLEGIFQLKQRVFLQMILR